MSPVSKCLHATLQQVRWLFAHRILMKLLDDAHQHFPPGKQKSALYFLKLRSVLADDNNSFRLESMPTCTAFNSGRAKHATANLHETVHSHNEPPP